jgi:hypothetical protein
VIAFGSRKGIPASNAISYCRIFFIQGITAPFAMDASQAQAYAKCT